MTAPSRPPEPEATEPPIPTLTITSTAVETTPTSTPDPCGHVEVLDHEPAEPFDLIGLVEVQRKNPADRSESIQASAREAACHLGGDAVIILYKAKRREGGIAPRPQAGMLPKTDLRGAVIRYRQ